MAASPSTENYRIGKGVWSFMRDGESVYTDLGNSPESNLTLTIEKLDHFSQRSGVRNKDKSIVLEKSGTVELQLDEWSEYNLGLALLATVNTDGSLEIFAENAIEGALRFVSDTEVGPNFTLNLD